MQHSQLAFLQPGRLQPDVTWVFARADQQRGDFRSVSTPLECLLGTHHEKGGRQGIGHCRGRSKDGGREDSLGGLSGAGIEDVPVALTLVPKPLHTPARGRQGPVAKPDLGQALSPHARQLVEVVNRPVISDKEIAAVVAESIAIFLPHRQAAQSGNIPVAFRAGTPVIARDIPGLSQHVHHKRNGYLFPVGATPEQLLEAVCYVRDNFGTLSLQARRDFESTFSEDNWERYYQWLIQRTEKSQ